MDDAASINSCCRTLAGGYDCDYGDPDFGKDIYPPTSSYQSPAICFSVLSVVELLLIAWTLRNIVVLVQKREKLDIKQSLIMNTLLLFNLVFRLVYVLDGPIQLFSKRSGLPLAVDLPLEVASIFFMMANFAYSSYTWLELILKLEGVWENSKYTTAMKTFFVLNASYIAIMIPIAIVFLATSSSIASNLTAIGLSVAIFINGVVFASVCYYMGRELSNIYDFDPRKSRRVKLIKLLAIGVALFSLVRVGNDLSTYIFPNWQQKLNLESYCNQTFTWSAYLISISLFTDIFPVFFFLIVFAPETKRKPDESEEFGQSPNNLEDALSEDKSGDLTI